MPIVLEKASKVGIDLREDNGGDVAENQPSDVLNPLLKTIYMPQSISGIQSVLPKPNYTCA